MNSIRQLAYAILDGTLIPIDRVAGQKPYYYSGMHRRHGVNVQVIADPAGQLIWASAAPARRRPRPDRGSHPRHHRRADQRERDPGQAALLPTPSDRDRAGHPRPTSRRESDLPRMKGSLLEFSHCLSPH
jgi:hypothetical protein